MINTKPGVYLWYHDGADGRDRAAGIEGKMLTVTSRATENQAVNFRFYWLMGSGD